MNPADNLPGVNPDGSVSTQRMSDMMKTDKTRLIKFARDKDALAEKFAPEVIWLLLRDLANALEACEKENQQLKEHYQQAIKDLKEVEAENQQLRQIPHVPASMDGPSER